MEAQYIKIDENGSKFYFKDKAMTKRHREDGAAIEYADGYKAWYINGKLHREDGAAIEYANGNKYWYLDDKRHRVGGPAVERADGDKEWWLDGKLHRVDGPAVEYADDYKAWYLDGTKYTEDAFKAKMNPTKELTVADIEKLLVHRVKIVKG